VAIVIPPGIEPQIAARLSTGRYENVHEVLDRALTLLEEHEDLLERNRLLEIGHAQLQAGESIPYSQELRAELRASARARAQRGETPSPDVMAQVGGA